MEVPEHDKLFAVKDAHDVCCEFYEFLVANGKVVEEEAEVLVATHFGIDLAAFDRETTAIMEQQSAANAAASSDQTNE